jgi:hypothetical protein
LYKLLVYEKGSFFLPHRDGEKLDRMVATVVIGLPSVHQGGELIVSHDGSQHKFVFTGAASGHELSYAAFYADCQHEVRPVRSGHRLCLIYNVTLAKSRGKKGVDAPSSGPAVAKIGGILDTWRKRPDRQKLAMTLDHQYTQNGLTLDALKGVDRARAEVLFAAAEQADCVAHLALVTLWQTGSAEYTGPEYSRRRRWYDDYGDYGEDASDYSMGEVFDERLSVNHWSDRQGNKVALGEIELEQDEIVTDAPLDDWDPTDEEFEGYTGNAGMTLERWYHRAAVVIWPRTTHFSVLCGAGTDASIGGLQAMVKQLKRAAKSRFERERQACRDFAAAIIQSWQPGHGRRSWHAAKAESDRSVFPLLLQELDDPGLARLFMSQVMTTDGQAQVDDSFPMFCKRHGWSNFAAELTALIDAGSAATIARNATLLRILCLSRDKNADRIALCHDLADRVVGSLIALDAAPTRNDWRTPEIDRSSLVAELVKAMVAVDADQPLSRLIDHTLASGDNYDLTAAHLAAIFALEPWLVRRKSKPNRAISHWLAQCRESLKTIVANPPQEPTDFRRLAKLSCKCSDCRELSKFLDNPDEPVHRFSAAKERRRHLHQIIDGNKCDLIHVTERRGRPYTLVCTKTTASYETACEIHRRDEKNLKRLKTLEKKLR